MSVEGISEQGESAEIGGLADQPAFLDARGAEEQASAQVGWDPREQEMLLRIPVAVRIVLGAARMPVSKLMSLARGSIIPLDRKVGDLVDIVVNNRLVARGEVVVLDDNGERFAVAVREIVRMSEG